MKTLLVKAPEGKGYYLNQQTPPVFVSGRPYVVNNSTQVQLASARNALTILGETDLTDEEFYGQYSADPDKALANAIKDTAEADPEAAKQAAEEAKKAQDEADRIAKEEKKRITAEKKAKAEAERKAKEEAKED